MSTAISPAPAPRPTPFLKTLAWKDYREQRAIWLAIAGLAVVLSLGIGAFARGGFAFAQYDLFVIRTIVGVGLLVMVAQGVVCGAQLFAGEKDAGSLAFLDMLSSRRLPVWRTKLLVGTVLTLLQALVLGCIMLVLGLGNWSDLPWFVIVGWVAMLWGAVAGALCDRVFPAILLGIVFVVGDFAVPILVPIRPELLQIALAAVPLVLSYRIFCANDMDRLLKVRRESGRRGPYSWQTLLWLAERQGRWIVWPGLAVCFVAGFIVWDYRDYVWPVITLGIGLICGLAVFTPEQTSEQDRFLGAQRFPPGRIWLIKSAFWALVAIAMAGLYYLALYYRLVLRGERTDPPIFLGLLCSDRNVSLFIVEWIIYGYACGQFAALLARRIVVAGFLAIALSTFLLMWWLPSLMFGGIQAWQILAVPLVLLVASRVAMWLWFSNRNYTRRHLLLLTACGMAITLWIGANLWYRAVEIPDVGEPFDLKAFDAKLTKAAQSEANVFMRSGVTGMEARLASVNEELGSPTKPLFPPKANRNPRAYNGIEPNYLLACQEILSNGWPPEDKEIGRWLDAVFAGEWVEDFRQAVEMPLGLVVDPRTIQLEDTQNYGKMKGTLFERLSHYATAGDLFAVRTMQLLARNQDQAALVELKVLLGLSRQFRHCLPVGFGLNWSSRMLDGSTLRAFDSFISKTGAKQDALRQILGLLQEQEKEDPDFLDSIKAYFIFVQNNPTVSWGYWNGSRNQLRESPALLQVALDTPWEGERQSRYIRALYQGALRYAALPPKERNGPNSLGLTLTDSGWTKEQWSRLMKRTSIFLIWPWFREYDSDSYHRNLRFRQLEIAITLYQMDAGHAPAQLDDLVPRYLPEVPLDPVNGEPFDYYVSKGAVVNADVPPGDVPETERLLPGQGVLSFGSAGAENRTFYTNPPAKKN